MFAGGVAEFGVSGRDADGGIATTAVGDEPGAAAGTGAEGGCHDGGGIGGGRCLAGEKHVTNTSPKLFAEIKSAGCRIAEDGNRPGLIVVNVVDDLPSDGLTQSITDVDIGMTNGDVDVGGRVL